VRSLGFLVEPDNVDQESHVISGSYNDGRLVGIVVRGCRNFGKTFVKASMAINQCPSMWSWYRVTSWWNLTNSSFKGVALFLGVHFGGTNKFDMAGFQVLRFTFANGCVGSAIYVCERCIMQVRGAWWLLDVLR
jgi:hypothetical protein